MAPSPPATLERVRSAIAAHAPQRVDPGALRQAAVLVPIVPATAGPELLFIMRPAAMPTHAGQPAFPGGAVDPGDTSRWHTALREAEEELGIPQGAVERVGQLDDLPTISDYHVRPCVGVIPSDLRLRPSPREVERWFTVPLRDLLDPRNVRTMRFARRRHADRIHFYDAGGDVIWGVTGAMIANLIDVLDAAGVTPR